MKLKMPSVAKAGPEMGAMTRKKVVRVLAPSKVAASSSSLGRFKKNWRMRKVPKALNMGGTMRPA